MPQDRQVSYAASAMSRHRAGIKAMLVDVSKRLDATETMVARIADRVGPLPPRRSPISNSTKPRPDNDHDRLGCPSCRWLLATAGPGS